jgi:hypothetical protein
MCGTWVDANIVAASLLDMEQGVHDPMQDWVARLGGPITAPVSVAESSPISPKVMHLSQFFAKFGLTVRDLLLDCPYRHFSVASKQVSIASDSACFHLV